MGEKKHLSFETIHILFQKWKDGTFAEVLEDWKWIFRYSMEYKSTILFYVFVGILSTTLGLVSSVASKYLIDIITGYQVQRLPLFLLVMVLSSIFNVVFDNMLNRISTNLNIYINNSIQSDVFEHILDADWLKLSKYRNGDILNRFNSDIGIVSSNAVSWFPTVVIAGYRLIATFIVILHYDWVMALIALGSAPVLLLCSRVILKKQREHGNRVRRMSSDLMTFESEAFYNMDTIKSFGIMPYYNEKLHGWQEKYKKTCLDYNLFHIKTNVLMSVVGLVVQFIAFGYCLFLLWTNAITYGTMTLFLQQRSNLTSSFNKVVSLIPSFLNSAVSARRIRELLELPKEIHVLGECSWKAQEKEGFSIQMEKVDFGYEKERCVLNDSNLEAHPGEIIALVGASGEGKTTLIRLLLGLVQPQSGKVEMVGKDGSPVSLNADTRYLFAYVPQGNTMLSGTVADNMRMVKPNATDEEIVDALKISCAWEFVSKMPEGIYSTMGEKGKGVSEGQAQRIAIARAVLRDAPILLMDEATSALDVTTERKVLRNIIQQCPNKTCIVTTHRPSVLNMCQRVYRVMDGNVRELSKEESERMVMEF